MMPSVPRFSVRVVHACILLVAAALGACASAPHAPTTGMQALFCPTSDPLPQGSLVAVDLIQPPGSRVFAYMTGDDREPRDEIVSASSTQQHNASIALHYAGRSIEFFALDTDGNLALTAQVDHTEQTLTLFVPPMIIAYAHMSPGDVRTQSLRMRVLDSKSARRQREAGSASRTVRMLGTQAVQSPLGTLSAHVISADFHADLSLADVTETSTLWFTPQHGLIAERSSELVKVLGAVARNRTTLRALKPAD